MLAETSKRSAWIVLLLVFVVITSLACGSTSIKLSNALPTTNSGIEAAIETPLSGEEGDLPGEVIETTETAEIEVNYVPLVLGAKGFGQIDNRVGYAFFVENPNEGLAVESTEFQVAFYNEQGVVVQTESGYIEMISPGQQLGIANNAYLDDGIVISRMEVQINDGSVVTSEALPEFEVTNAIYIPDEYWPSVTGVIANPYTKDLTTLRASAILYNEAGEIVGGGFTYVNFLLAEQSTGVHIPVTGAREIAKVEIYTCLSGLSWLTDVDEMPSTAQALVLKNFGYGMGKYSGAYGIIFENPNDGYAVEDSKFRLIYYDADGMVVSTDEGYIEVILPNQVLGLAGSIYLGSDVEFDHIEVQFLSGNYIESTPMETFTTQNVNLLEDTYSSSVTGEIVSPYTKDITDVKVSVVGFNAAGEIIGGGYTYVDFIPAGGTTAFDTSVTFSETPAEIQVYVFLSGISDIEE